jgi:hypothetical protein
VLPAVGRGLALAALSSLALASPAAASIQFSDTNVLRPSLQVNGKGEALVTYLRPGGTLRRVLVWGAVNARAPSRTQPQVRFHFDYAGGWGKYHRRYWTTFRNSCRRYTGPPLPLFVAGCTAPDGSWWTLQRFQRRLPLLGFDPWLPWQSDWELHISHWLGQTAMLEVYANWTYDFGAQGVFGRLTYLGEPVYGFSSSAEGRPRDRYSRNVYIDTFNSAYGRGWRRESGILTHGPTGTFCHSFVPQRPPAGYPSSAMRPAAPGERYRVTVVGPGVTPIVQWEGAGLPAYNAGNPDHVATEVRANAAFDRLMADDRVCRNER